MVLTNYTKEAEYVFGSGSGVIINKQEIATNCHVAMAEPDKETLTHARDEYNWDFNNDKIRNLIWIKLLNGKEWAEAKLTKKMLTKIFVLLNITRKIYLKLQ